MMHRIFFASTGPLARGVLGKPAFHLIHAIPDQYQTFATEPTDISRARLNVHSSLNMHTGYTRGLSPWYPCRWSYVVYIFNQLPSPPSFPILKAHGAIALIHDSGPRKGAFKTT